MGLLSLSVLHAPNDKLFIVPRSGSSNLNAKIALLATVHASDVGVGTAVDQMSQRLQMRQLLFDAIEPLERGFKATAEQRAEVSRRIDELAKLSPTPEPTAELGGEWTLIYTDAPDIISIPTGPLASLSRIGQEIDSSAKTIANVIEYKPSALASGLVSSASGDSFVQKVFTDYAVASSTEVRLDIKGLGLAPKQVLGFEVPKIFRLSIKGPLTLPFGRFEILYLDDEIRIIRTGQGWCSVNRRGIQYF